MSLQNSHTLKPATFPTAGGGPNFRRDLIALMPYVRAMAHMLCRKHDNADDMAQEALTRAWRARDSFAAGTNLEAWVFTILRNAIFSQDRKRWREVEWDESLGAQISAPPREQEFAIELSDTARALARLPYSQREALVLVAVCGFRQAEAGAICGVPAGTVKSRASRARAAMLSMLDGEKPILPRSAGRTRDATSDVLALLSDRTRFRARRSAQVKS